MKRLYIFLLLIAAANSSRAQYTGGSSDGFSNSSVTNQNPLPNILSNPVSAKTTIFFHLYPSSCVD